MRVCNLPLNAPIDGLHLRIEGSRTDPAHQDHEEENSSGKNRHGGSWDKTFIRERSIGEQRLRVAFRVLTANRNRVAKRCWFQKRQERGTKKSLQMSCPGCFTFVKTVSRQAQTLNKLNRLLSQSVEAPRVSVTPYSAKKFAVTRCSLTTKAG